jgi:hypothetical protein
VWHGGDAIVLGIAFLIAGVIATMVGFPRERRRRLEQEKSRGFEVIQRDQHR